MVVDGVVVETFVDVGVVVIRCVVVSTVVGDVKFQTN